MSDVIKLLPDSVANQIAAGEVIQRPASVIKELVENAVDAGAHSIKIILRDGGKNLIQVIDDGCGMSETDARLAFERHATSKIKQAADLFDLHTMGFRGEALPSIAAVAQIDLRTMRKGETIGTHLQVAASKFESQVPDACPAGTNLAVKNLFFNFPARRKFLKKDSVELTHIIHEFERLALVNPDKEFLLVHNDITLHQLLPGSLKQRVVDLFGKSLERQLIPVSTETSLVKIYGFVCLPENARKRNPLQYFFVNGRNMRHPYFHKAVLSCYEDLIPNDHQPNFFLNFEVDPSTIDVNIHPTKSEIKFENEAPIWQILVAAIKESLGKFNAVPSIDFDSTDTIDIPVFNPAAGSSEFKISADSDYNPFAQCEKQGRESAGGSRGTNSQGYSSRMNTLNNWEQLYDDFKSAPETLPAEPASDPGNFHDTDTLRPSAINNPFDESFAAMQEITPQLPETKTPENAGLLQLRNKYLVVPSRNGLMVIDRHRAHIKVLYERFLAMNSQSTGESQQVLFPETITVTTAQNVILETILDDVRAMGFDLSYLGDNVWAINAMPAVAAELNPVDTLLKMIEHVEEGVDDTVSDIHRKVAHSMAKAAAVQPGQQLSQVEADALLSAFFSLPDPAYTPDGLSTFFTLDTAEIAKRLN